MWGVLGGVDEVVAMSVARPVRLVETVESVSRSDVLGF
jgi:hypothetical protein